MHKYPKKILYCTDFFPHESQAHQAMVDSYVTVLEDFLQTKRQPVSLVERWSETSPAKAQGKSLQEYIEKSGFYPFYYDGYHNWDYFREGYSKVYGRLPYVGPYVRWKWKQGSGISEAQRKQAKEEIEVYRRWFEENILGPDIETSSTAVMILPVWAFLSKIQRRAKRHTRSHTRIQPELHRLDAWLATSRIADRSTQLRISHQSADRVSPSR